MIHGDELEALGVNSIEEALEKTSGIFIRNTFGVKTLSLRGASDGNVKFLYNGLNLKDSASIEGSPVYGFIPIDDVERIEIIHDGQSVIHGSGAGSGVINIISKNSDGISNYL